jgi:hypothetical protein
LEDEESEQKSLGGFGVLTIGFLRSFSDPARRSKAEQGIAQGPGALVAQPISTSRWLRAWCTTLSHDAGHNMILVGAGPSGASGLS